MLTLTGLWSQPAAASEPLKNRMLMLRLAQHERETASAMRGAIGPAAWETANVPSNLTLDAVADATVSSAAPDTNFGGDDTLVSSYASIDTVQEEVSLVKFDLSSLPAGAVIDSAQLQLYLTGSAGADPVLITAYFVASGWSEGTVTWNSFPTADPVGVNTSIDSAGGYKAWTVTSHAQSWLSGANDGLYLRGPSSLFSRTFYSRESGVPPQLAIEYHISCPADAFEPNDTFEEAAAGTWISTGAQNTAYICPNGDDDYFAFDAVDGQHITLDLYDLPADFDLELYNPLQGFVLRSANSGTLSEQILYSANQPGRWYARVYGYNGAYRVDASYHLLLTLSAIPTPTDTLVPPPTHTRTRTPTPTSTRTRTPTRTSTRTPSRTRTFTPTGTQTLTPTSTPAPTSTSTPHTPTISPAPTHTRTRTPTFTRTRTPTRTSTRTPSRTRTPTGTRTSTRTRTPSRTRTATRTSTSAPVVTLNLCAVADSVVTDADPAGNYGNDVDLRVGYGAGENEPFSYRSLLRFDLSFIPPDAQVRSATLETRLNDYDTATSIGIDLYQVTEPWEEMVVTWQNQPNLDQSSAMHTVVDGNVGGVFSWNIRELVQFWIVEPDQNHGLELRGPEGTATWSRTFDSRHYTPFCPRLVLKLRSANAIPTPTFTATPTPTPTATYACPQADAGGDSFQQASPINTGGNRVWEYICPSGDVDWWQFAADFNQEITIHLGGMPQAPPADYDLLLINPSGGQVASSELFGASKDEYINVTVYQAGNYRVLVRGKGVADWSNKTPYQLSVETKYVCIDPNDAGDTFLTATPIQPSIPLANIKHETYGYICPQGDEDLYKFDVPGGQNVLVMAKLSELPADYNLYLYSEDSQFLGQSTNTGTSDELIMYSAQNMPGAFRVHVQGATWSSYHSQSYKLEVSLLGTADLTVQSVEIIQVIQDPKNTVRLVAGKPAVARVYIGAGGIVHGPISGVTVRLKAWQIQWGQPVALPGVVTAGPTSRPNGVLDTAKRLNYNGSYNLVLPAAWMTGPDIKLEAEVNPGANVPETNFNNNTLQTGNIGTRITAPLNVGLVPVRAANLTPSLTNNTLINNMLGYLRAVFPAKTINVWHKSGGPLNANYNYKMPGDGTCGDGWGDLLDDLEDIYDDWSNRPPHAFVYGLLDAGVPPGPGHGCGQSGEPIAAGMLDNGSGPTMGHEMGHNFGRKHAPCGVPDPDGNFPTYLDPQGKAYPSASIGYVGLNPSMHQTFDPNKAKDLMSYCGPEWFSPYNYTAILNGMPSKAPVRATDQQSPHITVSGHVVEGGIELPRPFWIRDRANGIYDGAGQGSYSVILRNAVGEPLFERRFDPPTEIIGMDHNPGHFRETMPYPPETAEIAFTNDGQDLRVVPVSANVPTVQVLSPNGGEVWDSDGPFTVRWQADDLDDDPLTFRVHYSSDGGETWEPLAVNLKDTELTVEAGDLAGGDSSLMRVVASDGVNTAADTSDAPFTVSDKAPLAWIIQPDDGAVLYPDQPIILQATATDPEEGPLPDERLTWTSDTGEPLGEGANLALPSLPPGEHRFTLSAEDGAGNVTETSITITIGAVGCAGDCDGNGSVDVSELVRGVNISLGTAPVTACPSFDLDASGTVTVDELIRAVNRALAGC